MFTLDNWDFAITVCFISEIENTVHYIRIGIDDVFGCCCCCCKKISLSHLTLAKINWNTAGTISNSTQNTHLAINNSSLQQLFQKQTNC